MADEILYAGLTDQRTTEVLDGQFMQLLADRSALPQHPALYYAGDLAGSGSTTKKIPFVGMFGYDLPTARADGAAAVNTALSDSSVTVTVSTKTKAYEPSDIARFSDGLGILNAQAFAQDAMQSHMLQMTDQIAALVGGFSNTVGSTGTDLSIANVLAGLTLLEVGAQGSIPEGACMGVLHTVQGGDLRTALANATGGALQWSVPEEQLVIKGPGFRGRYLGVDWFVSGFVDTANAGADRAGGIFVRGAICWADMSQQAEGTDQIVLGGKLLFERDRTAKSGLTAYVSHSINGSTEGLDAAGVSIITDA